MGKAEKVATEVQETEPGATHTRVIILWILASANNVVPLEQVSHPQNARSSLTLAPQCPHVMLA